MTASWRTRAPSGPPPSTRRMICERDDWRCQNCGQVVIDDPGHVHHRKRRREGGHTADNLMLLCARCHDWVHASPRRARELGYIVGMAGDPAAVPMFSITRGWVLLSADYSVNAYERTRT